MSFSPSLPVICLMGPTASGKTSLAIELCEQFPCEIISVDSAMVYRYMDIGTAKPAKHLLRRIPHHLIDILDPKEVYSAGQFRVDALSRIEKIIAQKKIPLLVGGSMLYFRLLQKGIAALPKANQTIRAELQLRAEQNGWANLHRFLAEVDPDAAKRIHVGDSQRIQRALEVYLLTGQPISTGQKNTTPLAAYRVQNIVVAPKERKDLHQRITVRFEEMLQLGFIDEVKKLFERGDLHADLPAMRAVGYAQIWAYLSGQIKYKEMVEQTLAAHRQLAKRQLTWLRSFTDTIWFDSTSDLDRKNFFALMNQFQTVC